MRSEAVLLILGGHPFYTHGQMPFSEWANNVPYYVVDADQVKLFYSRALPLMNDEFKKKGWPIY